jgi:hypothetical protein
VVAALPAALMAAGSIAKGIGGYAAGRSQRRTFNQQAVEELNAGASEELRIRDSARMAMGEQIAAQFSNGMQGGTGSALDALAQSQINAALDAARVRREHAGKAASMRAQGKQAARAGSMSLLEGFFGAGSAVLGARSDWAAARRGTSATAGPARTKTAGAG